MCPKGRRIAPGATRFFAFDIGLFITSSRRVFLPVERCDGYEFFKVYNDPRYVADDEKECNGKQYSGLSSFFPLC